MDEAAHTGTVEVAINIYQEHILPIIKQAQDGDELLFVTPSTFFGFYSIGARTYEEVCKSLHDAKERGVQCRILIDVGDVLTAMAAQGLLRILRDGEELRDMPGNWAKYSLLLYRKHGSSVFVEFRSDEERELEFLPGVRVRPFGSIMRHDTLGGSDAKLRHGEFQTLWDLANPHVKASTMRYLPSYYIKRRFDLVHVMSLFAFLACGGAVGVFATISWYENFTFTWWVVLAYVLFSIAVGVAADLIAGWITWRGLGRN